MNKLMWILEDDLDLLELMTEVAKMAGYTVVAKDSLKEAWVLLHNTPQAPLKNQPGVIVSDLKVKDGFADQWLKVARQKYKKTKIFCISSSLNDELIEEFNRLAIKANYKPISLKELFLLLKL